MVPRKADGGTPDRVDGLDAQCRVQQAGGQGAIGHIIMWVVVLILLDLAVEALPEVIQQILQQVMGFGDDLGRQKPKLIGDKWFLTEGSWSGEVR